MAQNSVKDIIIAFLKTLNIGTEIGNYVIETDLPHYGKTFFGKLHSPGMYAREWRRLREDRYELTMNGIGIKEFFKPNNPVKFFKIEK